MADNQPDGLDDFLANPDIASDDPQQAAAARGFQQTAALPIVQNVLSGANLDAYNANLKAAMAGDPNAQLALAQHSMGTAMGSLEAVPSEYGIVTNDIKQAGNAVVEPSGVITQNLGKVKVEPIPAQARGKVTVEPLAGQAPAPMPRTLRSGPPKYAEGGEIIPTAEVPSEAPEPTAIASAPEPAGLDAFIAPEIKEAQYGGLGQQAATAAEGAAEAATFGTSTALERALGVPGEDIVGRREANPVQHALGQVAGLATSSLIPGIGEANLLRSAGEAGAKALGLGLGLEGASTISKIGSVATRAAIDNMGFQAADEASKLFSGDPEQSVETAVTDIGLAGLIGGGLGSLTGSAHELWKATVGAKTGGILSAVANHMGGIEGQEGATTLDELLAKSGVEMPPELRAALSDPNSKQMFDTLNQSDTTSAGRKLQNTYKNFRRAAGDNMVSAFGRTTDDVHASSEISKYESGKTLAKTLADEYSEQVEPLASKYDKFSNQFKGVDLEAGPEGTKAALADKIGKLAQEQGWTASPSSEIMGEVNRVMKELPNLKTLNDLTNYIKQVGENTASKLPFGQATPVSRAGGLMKSIMREEEANLIGRHVGSEEGVEALAEYEATRKAYAKQAKLKDALDDRLHIGGSTSGYAKSLNAAGQQEGEKIFNKLATSKDADLLNILKESFPATAAKLKELHLDGLLAKAKEGDIINTGKVIKGLQAMSPELRNFVVPVEAQDKIEAIGHLLDKLKDPTHNFSNTARTADKLFKYIPASAIGMATMLVGHNPVAAAFLGILGTTLGKDAPDAMRLAMLKWLGSSNKVDAAGFRSLTEFAHATIKGENIISKAAKNIFRAGQDVLPQAVIPSESDRHKLDKQLKALQKDPSGLLNAGGQTGHYLPNHAQAMGTTASKAVNFLNSQRPDDSPKNPLDSKIPVSAAQKMEFNRLLDLAQQPLLILPRVKDGSVTSGELQAVKTMYPSLYNRLAQKLTNEMLAHIAKGDVVPYRTKMGVSLFLGQPLDSSMTPKSILNTQLVHMGAGVQQALQPSQNQRAPASAAPALNKLPKAYMTPLQSMEANKAKH